MPIFHKYSLTQYAHSPAAPITPLSIDKYVVQVYDVRYYGEVIEHKFDEWSQVREYIDNFYSEPFYEDWNYSIAGLVYC